ncbi:hypothetical protein [Kitasatospora terrestris]|uniref:Uncharacterized protein n=1 Tax=Kitasatospora terrestris TaxID=258051 RepID=A0ABP9E4R7_9ACTN
MDFATLRASQPGRLRAAAQAYRGEAERFVQYEPQWRDRVVRPAAEGWTGNAAQQAEAPLYDTQLRLANGEGLLRDTAETLDHAGVDLERAKEQMDDLVSRAEAAGWLVGEDGSLSRRPDEPQDDPQQAIVLQQQAEEISRRMADILRTATDVDADAAKKLQTLAAAAVDRVGAQGGGSGGAAGGGAAGGALGDGATGGRGFQ